MSPESVDKFAIKKRKYWHISPGIRVVGWVISGQNIYVDLIDYLYQYKWCVGYKYRKGYHVVVQEPVWLACRTYLTNGGFCDMGLGMFLYRTLGTPRDLKNTK